MVNKELFILSDKDDRIIFAPLKGIVLSVTGPNKLAMLEKLLESGKIDWQEFLKIFPEVLLPKKEISIKKFETTFSYSYKLFEPTSVSLFTTFDCNLQCIYCYSEAGQRKDKMSWQLAKDAIDFVIGNALKQQKKQLSLNSMEAVSLLIIGQYCNKQLFIFAKK